MFVFSMPFNFCFTLFEQVAKTFVTRCLVGEPGITYKYLGMIVFGTIRFLSLHILALV